MVITSPTLFARARGGDRYWKRRRILALSAHFVGRRNNCYSLAVRAVHRALRFSTLARRQTKKNNKLLWEKRIDAACYELDTSFRSMKPAMTDIGIALDRKVLQNMAIWEPRSFRALALLSRAKEAEQGFNSMQGPPPGVITRGML